MMQHRVKSHEINAADAEGIQSESTAVKSGIKIKVGRANHGFRLETLHSLNGFCLHWFQI